ncbi:NAD(P)-binding domain-containing protein [Arthrobacter sp. H14-L1]|uniref:NAD(P)-binding domain-containing protein n=1 Tax=Arthrobacter sp. H14-L1 TaxID=2996697 RepID=UPI00226F09F3|nr:NAD(P)-binding domain-containing protein [Arthrobacter sp. H14-L1]MCY0906303.1 NAD(P)-binding domain-containing protein [Arthrobacter sp. H14-L1]
MGFVDLGLMGAPMAASLLPADWQISAWNRPEPALVDFTIFIAEVAVGPLASWRPAT